MESTLRLFKAVPVNTKEKKESKYWLEKTLTMGFVFSPEVIANYTNLEEIFKTVVDIYGITAEQINNSFHKSWQKMKNASIEQLFIEQIFHYLTTYGFEAMGVNSDYVYIPDEVLEIPEIKDIKLVVINGYTKEELKYRLLKLLNSGIALSEKTKQDIIDVSLYVGLSDEQIKDIKNKEVRIVLYDYLDLVPSNPIEFLRYIIYKATEKTLIIKNPALVTEIKNKQNVNIIKPFYRFESQYGLEKLAEIFYRFKPLFLAFRTNKQLKIIINKIRRLAVKNHKPMPEDYLNCITSKIKNNKEIIIDDLNDELSKVNIFRKIRLAYALKFRTKDVNSILYKIRNGKGYATDFNFDNKYMSSQVFNIVLDSIIFDISKNVKDRKIYVPEYITYTLPATEKQFTGNFPTGTFITIPSDMIFGIHWDNVNTRRIDLDLAILSKDSKIGWDSAYRNDDKSILFSGDMTDAQKPNGATELFYVKKQIQTALILTVNYYNYNEIEVPFRIIVASEKAMDFRKNYMVNPNNVYAFVNSSINQKQKILGLIITTTKENRFYFTETYLGKSITSSNSEFMKHCRQYLFDFYKNTISLNEILKKAGGYFTSREECEVDLSPENLIKDTILNLLYYEN